MNGRIHAPQRYGAYNLLDNSDFANPVNQRGQTTYSTDWAYSIDRWELGDGGSRIQIVSGGIQLDSAGGVLIPYVFQRLERLPAGTYTYAAKYSGNTGIAVLTNKFTEDGLANAPSMADAEGVLCLTFTTDGSLDSEYLYFRLQQAIATAQVVFEWAALYEGAYTADTLPPYVPKGYAVELMECQRYYLHNIGKFTVGYFFSDTSFDMFIDLSVPMRAIPNAVLISTDNITTSYSGTARTVAVTGISAVEKVNDRKLKVSLTTDSSNVGQWTTGWTYITTINLSADL